ncbi:unnamed protein product, partial [Hapterophycus canaliculatus]
MEDWKEMRCRRCPGCGRTIEKLSGCDLMVCGMYLPFYTTFVFYNMAHHLLTVERGTKRRRGLHRREDIKHAKQRRRMTSSQYRTLDRPPFPMGSRFGVTAATGMSSDRSSDVCTARRLRAAWSAR